MASGHGKEEARCTSATPILATILTSVTACQISLSPPGARINLEQKGLLRDESFSVFEHLPSHAKASIFNAIKEKSTKLRVGRNEAMVNAIDEKSSSTRHHNREGCTRPPRSVQFDSHRYDSATSVGGLSIGFRKNASWAVLADAAGGLLLSWLIKAKSELGTPD